jgi:hypothetical protein
MAQLLGPIAKVQGHAAVLFRQSSDVLGKHDHLNPSLRQQAGSQPTRLKVLIAGHQHSF